MLTSSLLYLTSRFRNCLGNSFCLLENSISQLAFSILLLEKSRKMQSLPVHLTRSFQSAVYAFSSILLGYSIKLLVYSILLLEKSNNKKKGYEVCPARLHILSVLLYYFPDSHLRDRAFSVHYFFFQLVD